MPEPDDKKKLAQPDEKATPKDQLVETKNIIHINGVEISYTVTVGTLVLKEETVKTGEKAGEFEGDKAKAEVFFIAYTRSNVPDKTQRPLTFAFNGGPGSSSVWLHMGVFGPRRVQMDDSAEYIQPPYRLVANEFSLLEVTDLVFIDPVSTGFSRPVVGEKAVEFHGFKKDIESVGDFIRLYTSRYQRWNSPKFLAGESYGTTRAAGLAGYLQDRHGLYLNGLILISSILDFSTAEFNPGNDLPFILYLPSYAATAWYHHKLDADLQKDLPATLEEVKKFALGEYTLAMMKGSNLSSDERASIATKVARYCGLSMEYVLRTDLRLNIMRFTKELLRGEGRTAGRLDSRFKGIDRDSAGETFEFDPSLSVIMGPYTAAFNQYVRSDLKFESDLPYEVLNPKVDPWSYAEHENRYVNVAEILRKAITNNPFLKVFVANGYFDLATPYFATEYTFTHLGLEPGLLKNISMGYYEAGHMMYIHRPSLERLSRDLGEFIRRAF
jgi:carboxypeptidase C (cathepsin A)